MTASPPIRQDPGAGTRLAPTSVRVRRLQVGGRSLVAKSAVGRARQRLRHEAELLQHLSGPDVVTFVALRDVDDRTDLVTKEAGADDLASRRGIRPEELLLALHCTAAAVDRLHQRGWSHGAICAEHVVLTRHGVALCSLGSARPIEASPESLELDRLQLVELIHGVLDSRDPAWDHQERRSWRRIGRSVRRLTAPAHGHSADRAPRAAELAAALGELSAHAAPGLSEWSVRLVAGMVGLAAVTAGWAALTGAEPTGADPGQTIASERTTTATPVSDASRWSVDGNQLSTDGTTYRVGTDGDLVAVAPLACGATPSIVLLRPSTGEVFRFDERPETGRTVPATHVMTAAGATGLAMSDDPACPRAVVVAADGAELPIEVDGTTPHPEDPP